MFPACLHFLSARIQVPHLVLCTTFLRPHSSDFFAVPGSLLRAMMKSSRGWQAAPMGWLPRQYVWAYTRQLLSMNVSHSCSFTPLRRNHCSKTSREFQTFWEVCLSQMVETGQRVQKFLKGGKKSRQINSMITKALGNGGKKVKSRQESLLYWADSQREYAFSQCEPYLPSKHPLFFPFFKVGSGSAHTGIRLAWNTFF